jgi:tetratricopeptide (TPR) repeat protein
MKRPTLFFGLAVLILSPYSSAQTGPGGSNAQSIPLDRTEILGRLALAYSPSYVAYLVERRGVTFAPSADFMSLVNLAGGDGILVDRLTSVDTSAVNSSSEQDKPIDHLAKCAELLHTGATESAEPECRAAIDENPQSPWPLLIVAKFFTIAKFVPNPSEIDKAKIAERGALLAKAAALAPDSAAVHFYQAPSSVPILDGVGEGQKAYAMDIQQFALAQSLDNNSLPDFSEIEEGSSSPAAGTPESITIEPEVLRQIELEPEIATKHTHLSQLYASARDFDQARSELREAIRLEPDNAALHIELAGLFYATHDRNSCLSELHEAARRAPFGIIEHVALAAGLESIGHTREAIAELEMLVDAHPTDEFASRALIGLYLRKKNQKSAIEELRRSLKAASSTYTDESEFVKVRYQDELQLARFLQEDRQFDAANEQFRFLLQMKPEDASLHNEFGSALLYQHNGEAAVAEFYQAIRIDPGMYTAHNNIGLYLEQNKDFEGAIAEFRRALYINPNDLNTEIYLGTALGRKGDMKAAEEEFQNAIQKNPGNPYTQITVGFALMELKDESAAITHLKMALELQPDSPYAENNLAWIYATAENPKLRNPAEALALARRAVETSQPPEPSFLDTLAEAQLLNGKRSEALATETKALALDPDNSELQSRLAHFREAANASANSTPKVAVAK